MWCFCSGPSVVLRNAASNFRSKGPCSRPRCIACTSRAPSATASRGCRITTVPARPVHRSLHRVHGYDLPVLPRRGRGDAGERGYSKDHRADPNRMIPAGPPPRRRGRCRSGATAGQRGSDTEVLKAMISQQMKSPGEVNLDRNFGQRRTSFPMARQRIQHLSRLVFRRLQRWTFP